MYVFKNIIVSDSKSSHFTINIILLIQVNGKSFIITIKLLKILHRIHIIIV